MSFLDNKMNKLKIAGARASVCVCVCARARARAHTHSQAFALTYIPSRLLLLTQSLWLLHTGGEHLCEALVGPCYSLFAILWFRGQI